jgi:hypothetical protein
MSSPIHSVSSAEGGAPSAGVFSGVVEGTNVYLTNGVFLYRIVDIADGPDGIVELEDCYSLHVAFVPLHHLLASRLRVITPAPTAR